MNDFATNKLSSGTIMKHFMKRGQDRRKEGRKVHPLGFLQVPHVVGRFFFSFSTWMLAYVLWIVVGLTSSKPDAGGNVWQEKNYFCYYVIFSSFVPSKETTKKESSEKYFWLKEFCSTTFWPTENWGTNKVRRVATT